ncbi:MAG: HlyD family efflux transporter periplasmic adaptor subunit, partial [Actinomycetota bacterium]
MASALAQLEKTDVVVPFTARVRTYSVEVGQFVQAGQKVAELVDDSLLEIHVPLDSREAQQWLPFSQTV